MRASGRIRYTGAAALALAFAAGTGVACYTGSGLLGAICESSEDCGNGQSCSNGVCSRCENGKVEPGEFCYGQADDNRLGGIVRLMVDGDFDEDGDNDLLAVGNATCGGTIMGACWVINILLNDGDASFETTELDPFAGTIESVEIGDLNGNDDIDAAFTLQGAPLLAVVTDLFTVRNVVNLPVPGDARSVRAADVDGDGDTDLLAAADSITGNGSVYLFRNLGGGAWGAAEAIAANPTAWLGPVQDINGDGHVDLIASNRSLGQVTILFGDGTGAFAPSQELPAGEQPEFLRLGFVSPDDFLDLVVANAGGSSITVFRGEGDGRFGQGETLPTGPRPSFIEISDVNSDAWPDLLVANEDDDKLSIYLSRFGEFPDAIEFDVSSAPNWIVHEDFDGDAIDDLVVAAGNDISFSFGAF